MKSPLILSVLLLMVLSGCLGTKTIHEKSVITEKSTDSLAIAHLIERNQAILDSMKLYIPKPQTGDARCDSLCDLAMQKALKNLNANKSSGANNWGFFYDEFTRQLIGHANIGQTTNERLDRIEKRLREKSESRITEIPVLYTPKWMQVLAGIGAATLIYLIYRLVRWIYRKINPVTSLL